MPPTTKATAAEVISVSPPAKLVIQHFGNLGRRLSLALDANPGVRRGIVTIALGSLGVSAFSYVNPATTISLFSRELELGGATYADMKQRIDFVATIASVVAAYALALCGLSLVASVTDPDTREQVELEQLKTERRTIEANIAEHGGDADVLHTINLSLVQLTEYYTLSKNQARGSFLISVAALIFGFITLISGVWLLYLPVSDTSGVRAVSVVSVIGGVLTQFIGASYFYLYNKTIYQLNYFYDRLVALQDTMLAIKLCDGIGDKDRQAALRETLILAIMDSRANANGINRDARRTPARQRSRKPRTEDTATQRSTTQSVPAPASSPNGTAE
jgi:hypothetical protein